MQIEQLKTLQTNLMDYMLGDKQSTIAKHISQEGSIDTKTRLNIYKNAYQIRLKETIETDHPQLGIYLGDKLFDKMVAGYIKTHPSSNTSLRQFADKLPNYLQKAKPFSKHPAISDLARFERKLISAFDAEDSERFSRKELEQLPQSSWPSMLFRFHPSMQIFSCHSNAVDIWQALKQQQSPPEILNQSNHWLLWRNTDLLTEFQSISEAEQTLLRLALKGAAFEELCEALFPFVEEDQIINEILRYLFNWLEKGIVRSISTS